jgi:hypothetical protein
MPAENVKRLVAPMVLRAKSGRGDDMLFEDILAELKEIRSPNPANPLRAL